jgi:hypothetical protein
MGTADDVDGAAKASPLHARYATRLDPRSAREILAGRLERASEPADDLEPAPRSRSRRRRSEPAEQGDPITDYLGSRSGKALQRRIVRGLFELLRKRL